MYDQATRAKARTIAEARGLSAAATVTGISRATLYTWAKAEGWALHRDNETPAAERDSQKGNVSDSRSAVPFQDPARELAEDADLARQVYRREGHRCLDGTGRPSWFRDATVAHGIMLDKAAQHGAHQGGGWPAGQEFTWEQLFANNDARRERIARMLAELDRRASGDG